MTDTGQPLGIPDYYIVNPDHVAYALYYPITDPAELSEELCIPVAQAERTIDFANRLNAELETIDEAEALEDAKEVEPIEPGGPGSGRKQL